LKHLSDATYLSVHTRRDDHSSATTLGHCGSRVSTVSTVSKGNVKQLQCCLRRLDDWKRLSGEESFINLQIDAVEDSKISWDDIADRYLNDISDNKRLCLDRINLALISDDLASGSGESLERFHSLLSLIILDEPEGTWSVSKCGDAGSKNKAHTQE
jgi:hypothetical protein